MMLNSSRCGNKMLSLDFFRSYDGIFRRYTDVSLKKVLKSQEDFFRSYNGF
jgi:hypothetical protein